MTYPGDVDDKQVPRFIMHQTAVSVLNHRQTGALLGGDTAPFGFVR